MKSLAAVWKDFLYFRPDSSKSSENANYDENYNFCNACLLQKENFDLKEEFNGKNWLKEIFMESQSRATLVSTFEMLLVSGTCSGSYLVIEFVASLLGKEYDFNIFDLPYLQTTAFFGLLVITFYTIYHSMLFIGAAIFDNTRRLEMLTQLTSALNLVAEDKVDAMILFPTINFLDA